MEWSNDATWPNDGRDAGTSSGFDEAMGARELAAMRGFVLLVIALAACVLLAAPLLDLDRVQWVALASGVAICMGAALWTLPKLRRGHLAPVDIAIIAVSCMLGGTM